MRLLGSLSFQTPQIGQFVHFVAARVIIVFFLYHSISASLTMALALTYTHCHILNPEKKSLHGCLFCGGGVRKEISLVAVVSAADLIRGGGGETAFFL